MLGTKIFYGNRGVQDYPNRIYDFRFDELMRFLANRAIWLDYICKDKNAMYIKLCARAGR